MSYNNRGSHRVAVRKRRHTHGEVKRDVFDLVIQLGGGRKNAEQVGAKVEVALREILGPTHPSEKPSSKLSPEK